jgi:hypothetical protein
MSHHFIVPTNENGMSLDQYINSDLTFAMGLSPPVSTVTSETLEGTRRQTKQALQELEQVQKPFSTTAGAESRNPLTPASPGPRKEPRESRGAAAKLLTQAREPHTATRTYRDGWYP